MSVTTRLETEHGSWNLTRYPRRRNEPLQAWCGADQLLIEAAASRQYGQCMVVNDDQGALSVALHPAAVWTDSAISAAAIRMNLEGNALPDIPVYWSTVTPALRPDLVLMRVPKLNSYFQYQLSVIHSLMPDGAELVCAGMDKHLSPHTGDAIADVFGTAERHRGARKARIFSAIKDPASSSPPPPPPARYHCPPLGSQLIAHSNVFSAASLDIGSRLLIENLPLLAPVEQLADLACGNGVLGLCARKANLSDNVHFFDESAMAIASARQNWQGLFPGEAAQFIHGDGLLDCSTMFDLILCNPPFHIGHSVDDFAGRRLLLQAQQRLSPEGALVIVANRHLPYGQTLGKHFAAVSVIAENSKFKLWRASSVA